MSDYKKKWEDAKKKFENTTGVKKPAPTKKNLFGKAVRQKVGIGEAFGKVDKLMPDDDGTSMQQKDVEKLGPLVTTASQEVTNYIKFLTDAINKEKTEHGKGADAIYRDLKILKADLEVIIASMRRKLDEVYAFRQAAARGIEGPARAFMTNFKTLKSSIESNGKKALAVVQNILKDPTPANFNSNFPKAARDITQNIGQIHKFFAEERELNETTLRAKMRAMEDPSIAEQVLELRGRVSHFVRDTVPLMREAGSSPLDSTLARFANSPVRFPEDASAADVKAGCKQFALQVKTAMDLGKKII